MIGRIFQLTESYLTRRVLSEDLRSLTKSKEKPSALIDFLCSTKVVEKHFKLVTQASKSVVGAAVHDGFIRNIIEGRKIYLNLKLKNNILLIYTDTVNTMERRMDWVEQNL